jgi:predicted ArsR family transcriptional regulator
VTPARQRELLQLLTEKNKDMNIQEIAAWLNLEEKTVSGHPPNDLLRL